MKVATFILLMFISLRVSAATPADYDRALAHVQAALVAQTAAIKVTEIPTGESPTLIAGRELGAIHSIERPGQPPQLVDTAGLIAAVRAANALHGASEVAASEAVARQIALLRSELGDSSGSPIPSLDNVRQTARAVLSQDMFSSDPLPPPSLAERFAAWLDKEFSGMHGPQYHGPTPNINPAVIQGILIAVGIAAFSLLVFVLMQALGRRGARSIPLALDETEAALVDARDNNSLLGLAEQQAKEGDFRRAFRLVYLAALVTLDTDGVLRFNRSKTNWEYLRALRAAGRNDVFQAMTPLTRDFDRVWYGFARTDASDYARALSQYQALQAAPSGGSR